MGIACFSYFLLYLAAIEEDYHARTPALIQRLPSVPMPAIMARLARLNKGGFMTWNLADAKNRLTEVVNLALTEGPQIITRRNDTVIVLSAKKYAELTGNNQSFKDFLMSGPSLEGLDLERDKSPMRNVEL